MKADSNETEDQGSLQNMIDSAANPGMFTMHVMENTSNAPSRTTHNKLGGKSRRASSMAFIGPKAS
jgi:hypothetical protein